MSLPTTEKGEMFYYRHFIFRFPSETYPKIIGPLAEGAIGTVCVKIRIERGPKNS